MGFLDPYAIDGATITAGQLRQQTFVATNGQTGVQGPDALRVVAVDGSPGVAGILPGSGVIAVQSRRESYTVSNTAMDGDALIDVPAAGSSGATHYVIVDVTDPEYHGQELAAGPRLVSSLAGLSRPFLPLLRIDLEPGEGFDATSETVDLRRVANPLKERHLRAYQLYIADSQSLHTGSVVWPDIATSTVHVPEWATVVQVVGTWATVKGTGTATGICFVRFSLGGNTFETQHSRWAVPDQMDSRNTFVIADDRNIPSWARGQDVTVQMMATKNSGPNVYADGASAISLDVEFSEVPTMVGM